MFVLNHSKPRPQFDYHYSHRKSEHFKKKLMPQYGDHLRKHIGELLADEGVILGRGHARVTYLSPCLSMVYKVTLQEKYAMDNLKEYALYNAMSDAMASQHARPLYISKGGHVLLMELARPMESHEHIISLSASHSYFRRNNFGWVPVTDEVERLVCLDYGSHKINDASGRGEYTVIDSSHSLEKRRTGEPPEFYRLGDMRHVTTRRRLVYNQPLTFADMEPATFKDARPISREEVDEFIIACEMDPKIVDLGEIRDDNGVEYYMPVEAEIRRGKIPLIGSLKRDSTFTKEQVVKAICEPLPTAEETDVPTASWPGKLELKTAGDSFMLKRAEEDETANNWVVTKNSKPRVRVDLDPVKNKKAIMQAIENKPKIVGY